MNYSRNKLNINPLSNFLIFSDPRGGSTWLCELIEQLTKAPILWEPLDLKYNKKFKDIGFGNRQHIPEDETWNEAKKLFDKLFSGQYLNYYNLPYLGTSDFEDVSSFIVKFCRGNALLPWLCKNYAFSFKPIHLVRHPAAVISSQLRHGAWGFQFRNFNMPNGKYNGLYEKHSNFLEQIRTKEEFLAVHWCVNNKYLLDHKLKDDLWISLCYEDLFVDPQTEINRVADTWGIERNLSLKTREPSKMTKDRSDIIASREQLTKWTSRLTDEQLADIQRVLNHFEVSVYSCNDHMPQEIYEK